MKPVARQAIETTALTGLSAVLFWAFFHFNSWVFSNFEYHPGVNWIFLPAGFRVILVPVMGLPASWGIMLGTWFIDRGQIGSQVDLLILVNGVVSGFTPWLVLKALEKRCIISTQLQYLTSQQLLNFTLVYAAANAVAHHLCWWLVNRPEVNIWVDIWPMFVGDTVGALLMLYSFKFLWHRASHWRPKRHF